MSNVELAQTIKDKGAKLIYGDNACNYGIVFDTPRQAKRNKKFVERNLVQIQEITKDEWNSAKSK